MLTKRDRDWIRQSFMVPRNRMTAAAARASTYTDASYKFTDTRLGGNFAINNPPGNCPYADILVSGKYLPKLGRTSSGGMGRFYSEQIDDNSQLIHMRFGVAQFTGMLSFFTSFYNGSAGYMARTGRAPGIFYRLGQLATFVVAMPYIIPIVAAGAIGRIAKFMMGIPSSKYYYLKPTAYMYWNRVNLIANHLAVNMNIIPPYYSTGSDFDFREGNNIEDDSLKASPEMLNSLHRVAPDIWRKGGGVDVYLLANRVQRLANRQRSYLTQQFEESTNMIDLLNRMDKYRDEYTITDRIKAVEKPEGSTGDTETLDEYAETYGIKGLLQRNTNAGGLGDPDTFTPAEGKTLDDVIERSWRAQAVKDKDGKIQTELKDTGFFSNAFEQVVADHYDGSQFVTFRTDFAGSVSESFNNSTKESEISSKINGMSSSARNARFSFSEGNTGISVVDWVGEKVRDFAGGALDMVGLSGIASMFGSALVDIPKQWDSSSFQPSSASFTIELRSPYGNDISRFQNLYVPLACLLAAALPMSTGKQSYTSPFLCEMYYRGRNQIRLGIIDSLTITRGTGNVGWTTDGKPLGIDVTFSVMDLSSIMHAPISSGSGINFIDTIFSDESTFDDYMAVLSSMSMASQIYQSRKLAINTRRYMTNLSSYWSASRMTASIMDGRTARAISSIATVGARGETN
jgi:hypothetical protein